MPSPNSALSTKLILMYSIFAIFVCAMVMSMRKQMDHFEVPLPNFPIGQYVRIIQDERIDCMHIAEIRVYGAPAISKVGLTSMQPNIAIGKPVTMSSKLPAREVTDGKMDTFVKTSCNDMPWVMVDLEDNFIITHVTIINRQDCCQESMIGAHVEVLSDKRNVQYTSDKIQQAATSYHFNPPSTVVML